MAGRNGVAVLPRARAPIVLKHDTITYTIERDDGETVALAGYRKGPGCPITVLIAYDEALAEAEEESPTEEERGSAGDPTADPPIPPTPGLLSASRYYAKLMRSERLLRRGLLQAVIPGLDEETANILASDDGPWQDMLVELGWWNTAPAETAEADADPEAVAGESTGRTDSPASVPPTPVTIP